MNIWLQIKKLRFTIISACLVTLVLCQRHYGFLVLFEILILLPWMTVNVWLMIREQQQRSRRALKAVVWLLSVVIVIGVHSFVASQTREKAQKIVDAVNTYHAAHDNYPENIESLGYSKDKIRSTIGMGGYHFNNGQPFFFYESTYVPFETEHYDFSRREWVHVD